MVIVGIIGGVASGKSTIARKMKELGAQIFDADRIGHEVLAEPEVITAAKQRWGEEVVDSDGQLIRKAIADHVFGDNEQAATELKFWESKTHPRITQRVSEALEELKQQSGDGNSEIETQVVVLDAAVLLKAGWDRFCDHLLFVDTPHENRLKRAIERGWTAEHFAAREAAQMDLGEKKKKATLVIDNGGSLERSYNQVRTFLKSLSDASE